MSSLTRQTIFAESDRRYPDFFSASAHGRSLGFETGATFVMENPENEESAEAIAARLFPTPQEDEYVDPIERDAAITVARLRYNGAVTGIRWARDILTKENKP